MAHSNSPVPGPIFVPKYVHTDLEHAQSFGVAAALVPANFVASERYRVSDAARESCQILLIDPQTNYFTYRGFLERPTYRGIPYAPDQPFELRYLLRDPAQLSDFVQRVLDFQRANGAGVLIAPYFYARDLDDARYSANLRIVAKAKELLSNDELLYAVVNVGGTVLPSPRLVDEVAQDYEGGDPHGFLLSFENVDDRRAQHETLVGLTSLTRRLASSRDVFVYPIAAFGQVLSALGANGFVSGVGWLEVFRESTLMPGRTGFAAERTPRAQMYYVSELFSYLNPNTAEVIFRESSAMQEYRCPCEECHRGLPVEPAAKKRHFMRRRLQEMEDLAQAENRVGHIRERLDLALDLADAIEDEALERVPSEHLVRWVQVLDFCVRASGETPSTLDEAELDRLIHEARGRSSDAPDRS